MKTRFTTIDLIVSVHELQARLQGMRVQQVYDIDNKTYLIKLSRQEEKAVLLIESGIRIHCTEFEWPKNPAPSGFAMKLRKHLKSRRVEKISVAGVDRVVDLQFGFNDSAYHIIVELYDRGNICLTDHEYTILNLLRMRTDDSLDVKLVVREKYPIHNARQPEPLPSCERLTDIIKESKAGESIRKIVNPHLVYGSAVIDHFLIEEGFSINCKVNDITADVPRILSALQKAEYFFQNISQTSKNAYIITKEEKRTVSGKSEDLVTYTEFHPYLFNQHKSLTYIVQESFDKTVDEFFSKIESQKLDLKTVQQEKSALKKLENVRKDHVKRVEVLQKNQETDKSKAELIEMNLSLVDKAILIIRSAIANQIDWTEINNIVQDARSEGDPVAKTIKAVKLDKNHFTMLLSDPFSSDSELNNVSKENSSSSLIDIDLDLSAYANARKYYDQKKQACKKELKTVEASHKALKSAERKTKQTLKDVATAATINKARKTFWFEKFFWLISSENFLIIGGRDQQQNELIVKRYLTSGDVYVHADLHGASSIVVKNTSGEEIPPKTLNEAGTMAVCCSAAWEAKVVTSAWWVHHNQVSKTAPSGEYLTTGSFMIRGKKNYLPPCHLIMGFGFMFKLDEDSVERHKNERKVKSCDDDNPLLETVSDATAAVSEEEIVLDDNESDNDEEVKDCHETETVADDHDDKDDEEETKFPDTEIKLEHVKGDQYRLKVGKTEQDDVENSSAEKVIFLGDDEPAVVKNSQKKFKMPSTKEYNRKKEEMRSKSDSKQDEKDQDEQQVQMKRGQKAKMKKIKQKYKDQDEEEKILRMELLASAGKQDDAKKKKKDLRTDKKLGKNVKKGSGMPAAIILHEENVVVENLDTNSKRRADGHNVSDDEDEQDGKNKDEMIRLLDSLTGCPVVEDEMLFAIPVCAPYSSLQNYKYKIKMTPGTGRRGKAAKTAVQLFLKDKATTKREKDLLKSVKDQDISRNLPGKVKLSAAQSLRQKIR